MTDFSIVVKDAYIFCSSKSYPELPLDSDILKDIEGHYPGWDKIMDLTSPEKYNNWLSAVRSELRAQGLLYRSEEG